MRLRTLTIENFLRIRSAQVDFLDARFGVFFGPNEGGKSSIREAIRFLLDDSSPRAGRRGNFARLIHRGAAEGRVTAELYDGQRISREVRSGAPNAELAELCATMKGARVPPVALGVRRFLAQPERAKRVCLRESLPEFGHFRVPAFLARLRERLRPDDAVLEWIAKQLQSGVKALDRSLDDFPPAETVWPELLTGDLRAAIREDLREISREFLREQLAPLNRALLLACDAAGPPSWPLVHVGTDLSVSWGLDAYGLASESARWRADALLAGELAAASGFGFLALDRAELLDDLSWNGLGAWLGTLAGWETTPPGVVHLDQVLVFGSTPRKLPFCAPARYFRVDGGTVTPAPSFLL